MGHLVADPVQPDQDYCLPEFSEEGVEDGSSTNHAATLQRIENFQDVLEQTRGTKLELSLLKLLSIGASNPDRVSLKVSSSLCIIHQLRNSTAYFDAACEDRAVRDWLERQAKRPMSTAYLICGFKTLTDARVELVHYKDNVLDFSSSVPAAVIAGAAGVPLPIPLDSGLDVAAGVSLNRKSYENLGYTATYLLGGWRFLLKRDCRLRQKKERKIYTQNQLIRPSIPVRIYPRAWYVPLLQIRVILNSYLIISIHNYLHVVF